MEIARFFGKPGQLCNFWLVSIQIRQLPDSGLLAALYGVDVFAYLDDGCLEQIEAVLKV